MNAKIKKKKNNKKKTKIFFEFLFLYFAVF